MIYRTTYGDDDAWQEFKNRGQNYNEDAPEVLDALRMPVEEGQRFWGYVETGIH